MNLRKYVSSLHGVEVRPRRTDLRILLQVRDHDSRSSDICRLAYSMEDENLSNTRKMQLALRSWSDTSLDNASLFDMDQLTNPWRPS